LKGFAGGVGFERAVKNSRSWRLEVGDGKEEIRNWKLESRSWRVERIRALLAAEDHIKQLVQQPDATCQEDYGAKE
jgi:hypothetical protein